MDHLAELDAGRAGSRRLELRPGHGLTPVEFGMSPGEVRALLKEPEGYEEWMGGNLNDSLLFRGLVLQFDRCDANGPLPDARLCGIVVHAPCRGDVLLWGRPLDAWRREPLQQVAAAAGIALKPRGGTPDRLAGVPEGAEFTFDSAERLEEVALWASGPQLGSRPAV